MQALKQRPFAFSCILFVLSSFIFFFSNLQTKITVLLFFLISETLLFCLKSNRKLLIIYIIPPVILSAVVSLYFYSVNYENILSYDGKECDIDFVITDTNTSTEVYSSYTVVVQKINGKRVDFKALVSTDGTLNASDYSSHSAKVIFSKLDNPSYGYSSRYSFLSKNIYLSAAITENYTDNGKIEKLFPNYYFKIINKFFSSCLDRYVDGDENALCQALLLGNKNKLPKKHTFNFRMLGLSHMLAVSGMHLSILVGSIDKLFERINIGKKKKHIIMILITFAYAGITGFSASINRAAVMLILFYLSFLISKTHDSVTSLCAAFALLLLISPNSMFDIGLWLSFLSTYGIVAVASPITEKLGEKAETTSSPLFKILLKTLSPLIFGIVPVIFSVPAIWISYGELALLSPVSNILFTPFLLGVMYSLPFTLILSFLPLIAKLFGAVSAFSAQVMLMLAEEITPHAPILPLNYDFTPFFIALLIAAYLYLALRNTKKHALYFIPFICVSLLFALFGTIHNNNTADDQKVIYSNTYYGDSFLVISNNHGLICDISGMAQQNAKKCEYYLNEHQITDLDSYVVTDYNGRGTDTLNTLITNTRLNKLYLPYAKSYDESILEKKFIDYAKENGIEYFMYDTDDDNQINFYGVSLEIKNTVRSQVNSPSSICVTISNQKESISYIGAGAYSTTAGKNYLLKLFEKNTPLLFGAYGIETTLPVTSLLNQNNAKLFFASSEVYELCKETISDSAEICVTDKYYEFWFNR